jgi:hypothetical protein
MTAARRQRSGEPAIEEVMSTQRLFLLAMLLGLLHSAPRAQVGSVLRWLRIGHQGSGITGIEPGDFFGGSVAALGDLDGDGTGDLAVGASGDDDGGDARGAIWILFLAPDGSVRSYAKISDTQGGFTGTLSDIGIFGRRLAAVGDLDNDGVPELATTSREPNQLWILFLRPDGSVRSHSLIRYSDPLFVPPTQADWFEFVVGAVTRVGGLSALGDLDGDGVGDLAVGSPGDPDGSGSQTGSVWILFLTRAGTLKAAQKISQTQGGFGGGLVQEDAFGSSLALLGDLDQDGHPELGVGSFNGDSLGRFWVVTLDGNGRVLDEDAFGSGDYTVQLPGEPEFFTDDVYAALGDLDNDGVTEVAMGFEKHDFPGHARDEGGFAIGFTRGDGSVRKRLIVSDSRGGLGTLTGGGRFGGSFAGLGDLDGDGAPELAVGAPADHAAGAVWILSLDPSALRNGSGTNPLILSQVGEPVFGATWSATLDCSAHGSGLAALWGHDAATSGVSSPYGEILITGNRVFHLFAPHGSAPVTFSTLVPPTSLALIDLPIHVQGACTGFPGPRLSNALDVLVGE